MIDKARAALNGTLGDYLYGQSPFDRGMLLALGLTYKDFTAIVRRAGDDDAKVLEMLQTRCPDGIEVARRWSSQLRKRHGFILYLIDVDDGYAPGSSVLRGVVQLGAKIVARYTRYRWPANAAFVGLEVEAQSAGDKAAAARGAEEEPYQWLTAQRLDVAWKMLLSAVLIFLIFSYVIHFLERIGIILLIIIGAIFFAYLVYPVVRWLNRKFPLIVAILLVYALIAALIAIGLTYVIPLASGEVATLIRNWPSMQTKLVTFVRDPHNTLIAHAPAFVRDELAKLPAQIPVWLQKHGSAAAGNALVVLLGTAAFLGACVAIPVLGAYLLYDSETIKRFVMGFVPLKQRDATLDILAELEQVIGGFIRGQLLVGASVGTLIAIGLTFVGEPYAILIGVVAAALDLIPYIGPVIAAIPAFIIAVIAGGFPLALKVAIVFVLANQLEGHVIAPNIVSRTIKLSPSAVLIAILIGGELDGVVGMFVAVPIAGIIRVLLLRIIPGSVSRDEAKPVLTKDPHDAAEEAAAP
jgi:predicted PurR-regulated permease PerM